MEHHRVVLFTVGLDGDLCRCCGARLAAGATARAEEGTAQVMCWPLCAAERSAQEAVGRFCDAEVARRLGGRATEDG